MIGIFLAIFVAAPQLAHAAANPKVTICHIPPGNPNNPQTITISNSALKSHLAHGDSGGACPNDCNVFTNACDDANLCTNDICNADGSCSHTAVSCNDTNTCTGDTCNPMTGCVYTPLVGQSCDDLNACTGPDQCSSSGSCGGTAIADCCLSNADCNDSNLCTGDTCNLATHTCSNSPTICPAPDACHTAQCAPDDGSCQTAPISCDDDNACTTDSCDAVSGCSHTAIAGCCGTDADCPTGQTCDNNATTNSTGTCQSMMSAGCASVNGGALNFSGNFSPAPGFIEFTRGPFTFNAGETLFITVTIVSNDGGGGHLALLNENVSSQNPYVNVSADNSTASGSYTFTGVGDLTIEAIYGAGNGVTSGTYQVTVTCTAP